MTILIKLFAFIGIIPFIHTQVVRATFVEMRARTFLDYRREKIPFRSSFSIVPQKAHIQERSSSNRSCYHMFRNPICVTVETGIFVVLIYLQLCFGMPLFRSVAFDYVEIYIFFFQGILDFSTNFDRADFELMPCHVN